MFNLPILESFLDKEVAAGYTWGNILEYWWIGLIIIIVAAVGLVGSFVDITDVVRSKNKNDGSQPSKPEKEAFLCQKETLPL